MLSYVIHHGNDWEWNEAQLEPDAGPFKGVQTEADLAQLACLKVM